MNLTEIAIPVGHETSDGNGNAAVKEENPNSDRDILSIFGITKAEESECTRCKRTNHAVTKCTANSDINGITLPPNLLLIKVPKVSKKSKQKAKKQQLSPEELVRKRAQKNEEKFKMRKQIIPCLKWKEGKCVLGDACNFSHDGPGFDPRTKQLCLFMRKGACTRGEDCIYSHDSKQFPCAFFHLKLQKGGCRQGDKCRFSHDPITDEQRKEMEREQEVFLASRKSM